MVKRKNTATDQKDHSTDQDTVVVPQVQAPSASAAQPDSLPHKEKRKKTNTLSRGYTENYIQELITGGLLIELCQLFDPLTRMISPQDHEQLEATISKHQGAAHYEAAVLSLVAAERKANPLLASESIIDIAIEYFQCLMREPNIGILLSKQPLSEEHTKVLYPTRSFSVQLMLVLFHYPLASSQFEAVFEIIFDKLLTKEKLRASPAETKGNFLTLAKYLLTQLVDGKLKTLLQRCEALLSLDYVDQIIDGRDKLKAQYQNKSSKPAPQPSVAAPNSVTVDVAMPALAAIPAPAISEPDIVANSPSAPSSAEQRLPVEAEIQRLEVESGRRKAAGRMLFGQNILLEQHIRALRQQLDEQRAETHTVRHQNAILEERVKSLQQQFNLQQVLMLRQATAYGTTLATMGIQIQTSQTQAATTASPAVASPPRQAAVVVVRPAAMPQAQAAMAPAPARRSVAHQSAQQPISTAAAALVHMATAQYHNSATTSVPHYPTSLFHPPAPRGTPTSQIAVPRPIAPGSAPLPPPGNPFPNP
jgi:hypothetical protein